MYIQENEYIVEELKTAKSLLQGLDDIRRNLEGKGMHGVIDGSYLEDMFIRLSVAEIDVKTDT